MSGVQVLSDVLKRKLGRIFSPPTCQSRTDWLGPLETWNVVATVASVLRNRTGTDVVQLFLQRYLAAQQQLRTRDILLDELWERVVLNRRLGILKIHLRLQMLQQEPVEILESFIVELESTHHIRSRLPAVFAIEQEHRDVARRIGFGPVGMLNYFQIEIWHFCARMVEVRISKPSVHPTLRIRSPLHAELISNIGQVRPVCGTGVGKVVMLMAGQAPAGFEQHFPASNLLVNGRLRYPFGR